MLYESILLKPAIYSFLVSLERFFWNFWNTQWRSFLDKPAFRQTFPWEFSKISRRTFFSEFSGWLKICVISLLVVNSKNIRIRLLNVAVMFFTQMFYFLYPLKTSENFWFSDVLRGYRNGTLVWNGWMLILELDTTCSPESHLHEVRDARPHHPLKQLLPVLLETWWHMGTKTSWWMG